MEKIFKVVQNVQGHSDEGYYKFKEQEIVSYHKTMSGATTRIGEKIEKELKELKDHIEEVRSISNIAGEYWIQKEALIKINKTLIIQGTQRDEADEVALFEVITIDLED